MDSEAVQVSQADREAAAQFVALLPYQEHPMVLAFARARLQEREECARVADSFLDPNIESAHEGDFNYEERANIHETAEAIAAAIRSRS